jgi:hypothetical protein
MILVTDAQTTGMETASPTFVLLLSTQSTGKSFLVGQQLLFLITRIRGVRFVNSIDNYKRAIENDLKCFVSLKHGLMTTCLSALST